jgi:competence protein ComEA
MQQQARQQVGEEAIARGRLKALRLQGPGGGWVPEPPTPAADPGAAGIESLTAPGLGELATAWVADRLPLWAASRFALSPARVLGVAVGVVGVALATILFLHHRSAGDAVAYPTSVGSPAMAVADPQPSVDPADAAGSIVVDVGGRVRKPGLVTLPAGARVADALAAAGGPLHRREVATLDLAARVTDGQLLLVGVPAAASDAGSSGDDPGGDASGGTPPIVDLDSATLDELETLPGVGPVTAQKIIDWRSAHSGFTTVAQLQQVPGIGPARYAELSPLVTP